MSPREVKRTNVWNQHRFGLISQRLKSQPAHGTTETQRSCEWCSPRTWIRCQLYGDALRKFGILYVDHTIYDHNANIHLSYLHNSPSQSQQLTQAIFWSVFPPSNQCHPQFHIQGRTRSLLPNVVSLHYRSEVFKTHIKNEAQKLLPFLVETNGPVNLFQTQLIKHHRFCSFVSWGPNGSSLASSRAKGTKLLPAGLDLNCTRIQTSASEKHQKHGTKSQKKNKFYFAAIQNSRLSNDFCW